MGKLTDEDRADLLIDASIHGDARAASMHGTSPQNVSLLRDQVAQGKHVSGAGKVIFVV